MDRIKIKCPACKSDSLFVDDAGKLCCSWINCPNPLLATVALVEQPSIESKVRELTLQLQQAQDALYMPGDWKCDKCKFVQHNRTLHALDMTVSARTDETRMQCPNDGEDMRRITWREASEENYDFGIKQMRELDALKPGCLSTLREANLARQAEWCPDPNEQPDMSFRAIELAGETGEACNVVKKLERERHGWRGSRDSKEHLAEELADVVISADLLAITADIDLQAAVIAKFNATSEKQGLATRL